MFRISIKEKGTITLIIGAAAADMYCKENTSEASGAQNFGTVKPTSLKTPFVVVESKIKKSAMA
uniref:Uncharacterized protein n=1 Tax=Romanomermis culicivorax TaxID=13658 RepID=A0A915KHW9_ROMCU